MYLKSDETNKEWLILDDISQLEDLDKLSYSTPVAIFKHSTSCGISARANFHLTNDWNLMGNRIRLYFLDILANRGVSNAVADRYDIRHKSPQVLLIKDGMVRYHTSHHDINVDSLMETIDTFKASPQASSTE